MQTDSAPAQARTAETRAGDAPTPPALVLDLQKIPLLAGVDAQTLERLTSALQVRAIERGHHVLQKGNIGEHLLFVLSGRLQAVDLTQDGREIGLSLLTTGDYFGELAIIDGLPRSASVIAREASVIAFLARAHALELIYHNPLVAERLLKRMAASIRSASNYRTIVGIPNAFHRVFALLNQFVRVAPGGLTVIEKMPAQQEIAIMANTSRETVSRAIHILIRKGVVEKDMRRLIVRRPEALRGEAPAPKKPADKSKP